MSSKSFLLQGLTPNSHLKAVKALLTISNLEFGLFSVAFATKGGVDLIAPELKSVSDRVNAFVGVRNGITSKEGLLALFDTGVNLYCVDTGASKLIYHPKIYVARNETRATVIIGSANLTLGGLNNNIESSVVLNLDLTKNTDLEFFESIVTEYMKLDKEHPEHAVRINEKADIDQLHLEGRISDETTSLAPQPVGVSDEKVDEIPTMNLKVAPLASPVRGDTMSSASRSVPVTSESLTSFMEVVWRSKTLTERDLGIPSGPNTHPTGSISLDKGDLEEEIDFQHYFRDEVFAALSWHTSSRSPTVDETHANFGLIVKGVDRGTSRLRIAHTTSTTSASYNQRNAMSRLSWGPMKKFVANKALIGRTLTLYRGKTDLTQFLIEID